VRTSIAVTRDEWLPSRTYRGASFDPERLAALRRERALSVSVCLPARDVEDTVGEIVASVRGSWTGPGGLVDEVLVVDGSSADRTAERAREAGALVIDQDELVPGVGPTLGKGDALWRSLAAARGDLVLWLDADVEDFDPAFVPGMLGPLLTEPAVGYVKALYRRPLGDREGDGGRVTEICARPLLNLFYPELAGFAQPLSGEAAGRRDLLVQLPFFTGYAVEIGLLIDVWRRWGLEPLAQVDLGRRRHDHQSTPALGRMAHVITRAVLRRLADDGRAPEGLADDGPYVRPARGDGGWAFEDHRDEVRERPPMADLVAEPSAPIR
jgi:glucosyl-3-phosphoglycerate synthase